MHGQGGMSVMNQSMVGESQLENRTDFHPANATMLAAVANPSGEKTFSAAICMII